MTLETKNRVLAEAERVKKECEHSTEQLDRWLRNIALSDTEESREEVLAEQRECCRKTFERLKSDRYNDPSTYPGEQFARAEAAVNMMHRERLGDNPMQPSPLGGDYFLYFAQLTLTDESTRDTFLLPEKLLTIRDELNAYQLRLIEETTEKAKNRYTALLAEVERRLRETPTEGELSYAFSKPEGSLAELPDLRQNDEIYMPRAVEGFLKENGYTAPKAAALFLSEPNDSVRKGFVRFLRDREEENDREIIRRLTLFAVENDPSPVVREDAFLLLLHRFEQPEKELLLRLLEKESDDDVLSRLADGVNDEKTLLEVFRKNPRMILLNRCVKLADSYLQGYIDKRDLYPEAAQAIARTKDPGEYLLVLEFMYRALTGENFREEAPWQGTREELEEKLKQSDPDLAFSGVTRDHFKFFTLYVDDVDDSDEFSYLSTLGDTRPTYWGRLEEKWEAWRAKKLLEVDYRALMKNLEW